MNDFAKKADGAFSIVRTKRLIRATVLVGASIALMGGAYAKPGDDKLSDDLKGPAAPSKKNSWLNTVGAVTYAKVVVVANSTDPDLVDLRRAVLAAGGSVFYKFLSINGLLVMLPVDQVNTIATRADVASISADRVTQRTYSAVESWSAVTGAVRSGATGQGTGQGTGIAFLDSGVMRQHKAMLDSGGKSRVASTR